MDENNQKEIDYLIIQWTHFSEYIEKLDTEHWHVFTVVFAAFGLISIAGVKPGITIICWIIPLTVMALFYYEAYRLREIAIMKGFLARVEKTINEKAKKKNREGLFNWYYSYELVFMTNNNIANQVFQYPIMIVCIVVWVLSGVYGWQAMHNACCKCLFIVVNLVVLVFDLITFVSISNTLRISEAVLHEDVTKKQEEYRETYKSFYGKYEFSEISIKKTICDHITELYKRRERSKNTAIKKKE